MHQLHLLNIIKGLDISVVAAIHDLNIAMKYCDEVYVIKDGKIICYGETREVLNEEIIRDVFMVDSRIYDYEDGAHIVFKGPVIEDE
jgi:iron complex transport system ATP-binding protein